MDFDQTGNGGGVRGRCRGSVERGEARNARTHAVGCGGMSGFWRDTPPVPNRKATGPCNGGAIGVIKNLPRSVGGKTFNGTGSVKNSCKRSIGGGNRKGLRGGGVAPRLPRCRNGQALTGRTVIIRIDTQSTGLRSAFGNDVNALVANRQINGLIRTLRSVLHTGGRRAQKWLPWSRWKSSHRSRWWI